MWLVAPGCSDPQPSSMCITGDLGRYRFERARALPESRPGCEAVYADPKGRRARVRVSAHLPGMFQDAGVPAEFEKHMVFATPADGGVHLGWYSDKAAVNLDLEGAERPEGPVLRAYLHRYPSRVTDAVQATQRDVELLRRSSRKTPGNAGIHLELARNYRKLGNTVMAAHEFHIAVEKDRSCYQCYLEMGTLYRDLRRWDLSIRALRKAAALRPGKPEAWLTLGDVSFHVHNRLEAIRGYTRALEAGLEGEDRQRASRRLAELEDGKFMIEILPGAQKKTDDPSN